MCRLAFNAKGSDIISFTHSEGRANSCGIQAICLRMASIVVGSSKIPPTLILPFLNGTNPMIALSREVFPRPD